MLQFGPEDVRRAVVDRSVEFPAWPSIFFGRIGCAVVENAVDASEEERIEFGLAERRRHAEMFGSPSERFGRGIRLAHCMRSRRGKLHNSLVGFVFTLESVWHNEVAHFDLSAPVCLALRRLGKSVEVEQVAHRAVSLFTCRRTVRMKPFGPSLHERSA